VVDLLGRSEERGHVVLTGDVRRHGADSVRSGDVGQAATSGGEPRRRAADNRHIHALGEQRSSQGQSDTGATPDDHCVGHDSTVGVRAASWKAGLFLGVIRPPGHASASGTLGA
jgi:hypothetical protein